MDEKLHVSYQCALTAQKPNLGCVPSSVASRLRDVILPLCSARETPPGVQCPALEPSDQERCGAVGAGPKEGHSNDPRAGAPVL